MKFLQLLFVGLFASNFVCGSQPKKDFSMIPDIIPGSTKEDYYEKSHEHFTYLIKTFDRDCEKENYNRSGYYCSMSRAVLSGIGDAIDLVNSSKNTVWSNLKIRSQRDCAFHVVQISLFSQVACASTEEEKDSYINKAASDLAECFLHIQQNRKDEPEYLKKAKFSEKFL